MVIYRIHNDVKNIFWL